MMVGLLNNVGWTWVAALFGIVFESSVRTDLSVWFAALSAFGPLGMGLRSDQSKFRGEYNFDVAKTEVPYTKKDAIAGFLNPVAVQKLFSLSSSSSIVSGAFSWVFTDKANIGSSVTMWDVLNGDVSSMTAWANIFAGPEVLEMMINSFMASFGVPFRFPDWFRRSWRTVFVTAGFARLFFQILYDFFVVIQLGKTHGEDMQALLSSYCAPSSFKGLELAPETMPTGVSGPVRAKVPKDQKSFLEQLGQSDVTKTYVRDLDPTLSVVRTERDTSLANLAETYRKLKEENAEEAKLPWLQWLAKQMGGMFEGSKTQEDYIKAKKFDEAKLVGYNNAVNQRLTLTGGWVPIDDMFRS